MVLELKVHVGKDRKVTLELPPEFEDDEVRITVESTRRAETTQEIPWEERPWTKEEIEELMTFKGQTGAEIASAPEVGSWAHLGITDPVAWVEEVRRQEEERRKWHQD